MVVTCLILCFVIMVQYATPGGCTLNYSICQLKYSQRDNFSPPNQTDIAAFVKFECNFLMVWLVKSTFKTGRRSHEYIAHFLIFLITWSMCGQINVVCDQLNYHSMRRIYLFNVVCVLLCQMNIGQTLCEFHKSFAT